MNDLTERLVFLEQENHRLRKESAELRKTIKELNKLMRNVNTSLNEIKKSKTLLVKDSVSFENLYSMKCRDVHVLEHMKAFWGYMPNWGDITDNMLSNFQSWLKSQKKRIGDGLLSETTIALYMTLIKGIIKRGYSVDNNNGLAVKTIKAAKEIKVWLRPNDLRKILEYDCKGDNAKLYAKKMCLISAITGARISDVERLNSSNIDGNTLRYIPIKTKNFQAEVPLTSEAKSCLNDLFKIEAERIGNVNPVIRQICKDCGIDREVNVGTPERPKTIKLCEGVHVHTFRHSYATIKYRYSGMNERQISNAMGHANTSMTLNNYVLDKSNVSESEQLENFDLVF